MVAQNTVLNIGVNMVFRFVEGILLHRKSRQIRIRATISTMVRTDHKSPKYVLDMLSKFCSLNDKQ